MTTGTTYRMRLLAVPLSRPIVGRHHISSIYTIVVEATGDGERGLGGLWFVKEQQARVVMQALRYFASVAQAASQPAALVEVLRREMSFLGFKGVTVIAMAGLEMALQDLVLRQEGRNLAEPIRQDRIPVYWSGFFRSDTLESWVSEADEALRRGFRAFKARVGASDIEEDEHRISTLRSILPSDVTLMLDAHQSWSVAAAEAALDRLAGFQLHWLEDPIVHNDYPGLARLVEQSPVPIAAGENEYLREGFQQLIDAKVPYLLADMQRVGGYVEWEAVAAMAKANETVLTPHLYADTALRLCAKLDQSELWLEYNDWWYPLMRSPISVADGKAAVPNSAGTGFDPDPAAVERFAVLPWETLG